MTGSRNGHLAIATHEGLASTPLGDVLMAYWEQSPNAPISILTGNEQRIRDWLTSAQIELGLGYVSATDHRLRRLWERPVRFGAIMAADHPLARRGRVSLFELAPYPLLTPGPETGIPQDIARLFKERKLAFDHRLATDSMALIERFATQGLGIAIKGRLSGTMAALAAGTLAFVPLDDLDKPFSTLAVLAREGHTLNASATDFLKIALKHLDVLDC